MRYSPRVFRVASALLRIALTGAAFGMLMVVWGTIWQGYTDQKTLKSEIIAGVVGGATAGIVVQLTQGYRSRGERQYYFSWMLAGVMAALVIVAPALLTDGSFALMLALALGAGGGLGLAVFARQVTSNHH